MENARGRQAAAVQNEREKTFSDLLREGAPSGRTKETGQSLGTAPFPFFADCSEGAESDPLCVRAGEGNIRAEVAVNSGQTGFGLPGGYDREVVVGFACFLGGDNLDGLRGGLGHRNGGGGAACQVLLFLSSQGLVSFGAATAQNQKHCKSHGPTFHRLHTHSSFPSRTNKQDRVHPSSAPAFAGQTAHIPHGRPDRAF